MGCYAFKQGESGICCNIQQTNELVFSEDALELNEFNDLTLSSHQAEGQVRSYRVLADLEAAFISEEVIDLSLHVATPRFNCKDNTCKLSFGSAESCSVLMSPAFACQDSSALLGA
jgi:hypothetical protein